MHDPGLVVVIDGPRCVGTSTTIAGLQRAWPDVRPGPLLEVGLDKTLAAFGPGSDRWIELVTPSEPSHDGSIGWGPLGRELVVGMPRAAAAWARAGLDVALDHVLLDHVTVVDFEEALAGLPSLHVGLVCDPDVLDDRERTVRERGFGIARAQLLATRDVASRDLVLDTTEATTAELVAVILAEVARRW